MELHIEGLLYKSISSQPLFSQSWKGPKKDLRVERNSLLKQLFETLFSLAMGVERTVTNAVRTRIEVLKKAITQYRKPTNKSIVIPEPPMSRSVREEEAPEEEATGEEEVAVLPESPTVELNFDANDVDITEQEENYVGGGDFSILDKQLEVCLLCTKKDILVQHPVLEYCAVCLHCEENRFHSAEAITAAHRREACCICGVFLNDKGCTMQCRQHSVCENCCERWFTPRDHEHRAFGCIVCRPDNIPKDKRCFRVPALSHFYSLAQVEEAQLKIVGNLREFSWADVNKYGKRANGDPVIAPHQKAAINVMIRKLKAGEGHILADDMGMGKTVTLAVFMHHVIEQAHALDSTFPTLLVTLLTLKPYWNAEIQAVFSEKNVVANLSGGMNEALKKLQLLGVFSRHHKEDSKPSLWLQIYHAIESDYRYIGGIPFLMMVFDEPHRLKHPTSSRFKYAFYMHARSKFLATGSVIHHQVDNIITMLALVVPSFNGEYESRVRACVQEINDLTLFGRSGALDSPQFVALVKEFQELVKPYVTRRVKADLSCEIVPKYDVIFISCTLASEQQKTWKLLGQANKQTLEYAATSTLLPSVQKYLAATR